MKNESRIAEWNKKDTRDEKNTNEYAITCWKHRNKCYGERSLECQDERDWWRMLRSVRRYERYIVTERRAWKGLKGTVCTVLVVHWKRYGIFLHTFLVDRAKKKKKKIAFNASY